MIGKLLKYDLRSLYKVIFFISSAAIVSSVIGGFALRHLNCYKSQYEYLTEAERIGMSIANFIFVVSVLALIATMLVITVLVFLRFYKNLYTDEGYLTFTLPASHKDILLSKTANAVIWSTYQTLLLVVCVFLYDLICGKVETVWNIILLLLEWGFEAAGAWMAVYLIFGVVATFGFLVFSVCLIQFCITVGALLARRAKLIVGIATYYAISTVLNLIPMVLFVSFAVSGLDDFLSFLFKQVFVVRHTVYTAVMLVGCAVAWGLALAAHFATKSLINKKLNL